MGRRNRGRMHPADDDSWGDGWGGFAPSEENIGDESGCGFWTSKEESSWRDEESAESEERNPFRNRSRGRGRWVRRFGPLLPGVLLGLLALALVVVFIVNWQVIRLFLQSMLLGAILGAVLFAVLSLRGVHFGIDVIAGGAIFGMIVCCVLRYNILGVNTEIGEVISALGPCLILLFGIYQCIKSIFR